MPCERSEDGRSVVRQDHELAAPPAEVWRALVAPEATPHWMGGFGWETPWVVGGPFAITGALSGRVYAERGTLLACEPEARLRYDHWSRLWRLPNVAANRAVLDLRLREAGRGTALSLRHELPAMEALAEHADFFWGVSLGRLKDWLERAEEV